MAPASWGLSVRGETGLHTGGQRQVLLVRDIGIGGPGRATGHQEGRPTQRRERLHFQC